MNDKADQALQIIKRQLEYHARKDVILYLPSELQEMILLHLHLRDRLSVLRTLTLSALP